MTPHASLEARTALLRDYLAKAELVARHAPNCANSGCGLVLCLRSQGRHGLPLGQGRSGDGAKVFLILGPSCLPEVRVSPLHACGVLQRAREVQSPTSSCTRRFRNSNNWTVNDADFSKACSGRPSTGRTRVSQGLNALVSILDMNILPKIAATISVCPQSSMIEIKAVAMSQWLGAQGRQVDCPATSLPVSAVANGLDGALMRAALRASQVRRTRRLDTC